MKNILVLYHNNHWQYPLRATQHDLLYCFRDYAHANCFYLNAAVHSVPERLVDIPWDLIIFTQHFCEVRGFPDPVYFRYIRDRVAPVKRMTGLKVAMPQDEYTKSQALGEFINEFGVDVVLSVSPPAEWPRLYPGVDRSRVQFHQVLTGYISEQRLRYILRVTEQCHERPIDICFRALSPVPTLGSHGYLKILLAQRFAEEAPKYGLSVDISTNRQDSLARDAWFRFLASSKYTIGVEGGASVHDPDGQVGIRTREYMQAHPHAGFAEVEAACFPGKDGEIAVYALSPRHFEACMTRTCQVLIDGEYNGVLQPHRHYIPLKRDFSNLDEVLAILKEDKLRAEITERAYQEIVASGQYSYRAFVEGLLQTLLPDETVTAPATSRPGPSRIQANLYDLWARIVISSSAVARSLLKKYFPDALFQFLRRQHWKRIRGN